MIHKMRPQVSNDPGGSGSFQVHQKHELYDWLLGGYPNSISRGSEILLLLLLGRGQPSALLLPSGLKWKQEDQSEPKMAFELGQSRDYY